MEQNDANDSQIGSATVADKLRLAHCELHCLAAFFAQQGEKEQPKEEKYHMAVG
jgi:hypothetical protein